MLNGLLLWRFAGMEAATALFGCAIGTTLSLQALKLIPAGIVTTLTSVSPVLILPVSVIMLKDTLKWQDYVGVAMSVSGIAALALL